MCRLRHFVLMPNVIYKYSFNHQSNRYQTIAKQYYYSIELREMQVWWKYFLHNSSSQLLAILANLYDINAISLQWHRGIERVRQRHHRLRWWWRWRSGELGVGTSYNSNEQLSSKRSCLKRIVHTPYQAIIDHVNAYSSAVRATHADYFYALNRWTGKSYSRNNFYTANYD